MSLAAATKQKLLDAIAAAKTEGIVPTSLLIPSAVEVNMELLGTTEVGSPLARQILKLVVRAAVGAAGGTLFGLRVVWDAEALRAE